MTASLKDLQIVVTGGAKGLGLGIIEALVRHDARVTVIGRDGEALETLAQRLGVALRVGDITDQAFAKATVGLIRPQVLILNAGATPAMGPIHKMSWDDFTRVWDTDVKAALYWIQAALELPLGRGSRVLLGSSGAAINGSPLSGGYAGAKRMLWMMANYANTVSGGADLGIRFQALLPNQIIGGTGVGDAAAAAYAKAKGVSTEAFLAGFGPPLEPKLYGDLVVQLLTDPTSATGVAYAFRGDQGIVPLEG